MKFLVFNYNPNGGMIQKVFTILMIWSASFGVFAQNKKSLWVDSVFQTMSMEEKAGQLFILSISSYQSDEGLREFEERIRDFHPGGILIEGGGPVGISNLISKLQHESRIPLLSVMEVQNGAGELVDSLKAFPQSLNIGAIQHDSLVQAMGIEIGRQLKLLGINMALAQNVDIDISESNYGAYLGGDKQVVASRAKSIMLGLKGHGILSGATHHTTEVEDFSTKYDDVPLEYLSGKLDTSRFYPLKQLIDSSLDAVVTSHFHFSVLDKKKNIQASISQIFMKEMLRNKLMFQGLMIGDIPYIQEISGKSKNEVERFAFEIGNDLLLRPDNIGPAIRRILSALKKNASLRKQLDESVKRILSAKYHAGLAKPILNRPDNILRHLETSNTRELQFKLAEASVTLVKNDGTIPIQTLEDKKFAIVSAGEGNVDEFKDSMRKYAATQFFQIETARDTLQLINKLKEFDTVVVSLFALTDRERHWIAEWLKDLNIEKEIILCSMGSPFDLAEIGSAETILLGYGDAHPIPSLLAQTIFGAREAKGRLPLTISEQLQIGQGVSNNTINRLAYGIPEEVAMSSEVLTQIDRIAHLAIDSGATPGCRVVIARNGRVVVDNTYGWKTYDKADPVTPETIYDLASITKVAATLQTIMFMYDKNLIDINKKVSYYLPELKQSNKKDFTIKDILTHQAGLWPYLPFWQQTIKDSTLLPEYYSATRDEQYPFQVSKDLFAVNTMKDSLWHWVINARVKEKKNRIPHEYTYSDMGFYIFQHLAEKILNQPMEDFLAQNFYEPIGAYTTGYLPLERFPSSQLAPTEVDMQFRKSPLVGYVHDQGAAMHGGIAGHAGLFSSANDLAKLGQMWLQKGSYGGLQYFKPETVEYFTSRQYKTNRRGLGWDKPTVSDWNGPTSLYASPSAFGHTGFTGTAIWVDPEFDLVFVFLSNRVYPDMFNNKLLTGNIRPRIQEVIYQSIFEYCKNQN